MGKRGRDRDTKNKRAICQEDTEKINFFPWAFGFTDNELDAPQAMRDMEKCPQRSGHSVDQAHRCIAKGESPLHDIQTSIVRKRFHIRFPRTHRAPTSIAPSIICSLAWRLPGSEKATRIFLLILLMADKAKTSATEIFTLQLTDYPKALTHQGSPARHVLGRTTHMIPLFRYVGFNGMCQAVNASVCSQTRGLGHGQFKVHNGDIRDATRS